MLTFIFSKKKKQKSFSSFFDGSTPTHNNFTVALRALNDPRSFHYQDLFYEKKRN